MSEDQGTIFVGAEQALPKKKHPIKRGALLAAPTNMDNFGSGTRSDAYKYK